jgi:hypothetical protein
MNRRRRQNPNMLGAKGAVARREHQERIRKLKGPGGVPGEPPEAPSRQRPGKLRPRPHYGMKPGRTFPQRGVLAKQRFGLAKIPVTVGSAVIDEEEVIT